MCSVGILGEIWIVYTSAFYSVLNAQVIWPFVHPTKSCNCYPFPITIVTESVPHPSSSLGGAARPGARLYIPPCTSAKVHLCCCQSLLYVHTINGDCQVLAVCVSFGLSMQLAIHRLQS